MAYIKSTLVGIFTLLVASIAYLIAMIIILLRKYAPPPGVVAEVGFDLSAIINRPSFWVVAIAAFALGFYWEFRRAR
jgi:hypothetical protein